MWRARGWRYAVGLPFSCARACRSTRIGTKSRIRIPSNSWWVDATTAREKQALATYQKSIQTAFREVADSLINVAQTGAIAADLEASVDAATSALRLASRRYQAGYSGYLDVLDAQRTLNVAQLALIRNRQAQLSASVDLMKSLGGGWEDAQALAGQ